ncbi:hypothetical protein ADK67_42830 [Saccharothrix sp. NRRL B-16348]|uniref:hypothetical protein n=1 Tax=Saccharothrix sp. NRRL B-16348 TaxID=1415542 RepID=UPI0006ADC6A1|nr:hypothetical protein [Saccharothrix sp. NRRL B-16348]KOX14145.1 hypothetical protein ADK67_42830 [Saccharothrix sp. NRRL B-16348]
MAVTRARRPHRSRRSTPELRHQDPASFYDLRTGSAADDAEDRCRAGTSTAERWTPIATASRRRVALTAFETPAGIVFCETTPLSVTVSSPQPDPGALAIAFTTAGGSMAGFNDVDPRSFRLVAPRDPNRGGLAARVGRVFLMPAGLVSDGVVAEPEVTTSAELVQRFDLATPPPSPAVVDRPVTPEDRASAEGRRLGECLAGQPEPIVDPSAWRAGRTADLTATESVQLGHYEDLLLLCRENRTVSVYDFRRPDGTQWAGATLRGVRVFDRFGDTAGGEATYGTSMTEAVIAEVTDARVASVTAVSPGRPEVTAEPVAGSVVLPGIEFTTTELRIVARDASGNVLEELTHRY